jgi:hypothetical protein
MPLTAAEINRQPCLLLYDDETLLDAVIALRDAEGHDWWTLVVDTEEGGYAATEFENIVVALGEAGEAALSRTLGSLIPDVLIPVSIVVEAGAVDSDSLKASLYDAPGRVAIITQDGEFQGVIKGQTTRKSAAPSKTIFSGGLVQLAGQYAEIPPTGTLSPRRRKSKQSKSDNPTSKEGS